MKYNIDNGSTCMDKIDSTGIEHDYPSSCTYKSDSSGIGMHNADGSGMQHDNPNI